jgi:hypothetical protein
MWGSRREIPPTVSCRRSTPTKAIARGGVDLLYDQRIYNGRARKIDVRSEQYVSAVLHQTPRNRHRSRP